MGLSKSIDFSGFLEAQKIKGVGKKGCENISEKFKNISTFRHHIESGTVDDILLDIGGIGEVAKNTILSKVHNFDFLMNLEDLEFEGYEMFEDNKVYALEELIDVSKILEEPEIEEDVLDVRDADSIVGLTIVMTGAISETRDVFKYKIESEGGRLASSVTKNTDILIIGDSGSHLTSKHEKALDLFKKTGKPIIYSERDFRKQFNFYR